MKTYQNPIPLPGQWPGGIGDPFVLRHNGRYYCYPSTSGEPGGIRAWTSLNLCDWEDCGYIIKDERLTIAYAPELLYVNGDFLLVTSPRGDGHFLFTGKSPLGPFTLVKDDIGLTIDGSLFLDDDGGLYFTHAEYPLIHGHTFTPEGIAGPAVPIKGSAMNHWTEGSMIFRRLGKYYITMTGNHLLSRAYRVNYAISDTGPLGPYKVPKNKTLLVNTDHATGSLGHSSTVIGPDLDSYWIAYHRFPIDEHGRRQGRFYNLDRMLFNGDKLLVSGPTNQPAAVPEMPAFCAWVDEDSSREAFRFEGEAILARHEARGDYTAEIHATLGNQGELRFGLGDAGYSALRLNGNGAALYRAQGDREEKILDIPLFDGFQNDVPHTFRLEVFEGRLTLLLDGMYLARDVEGLPLSGFLGTSGAVWTSCVAISHQVRQSSDRLHWHALPGSVEAALFLPHRGDTLAPRLLPGEESAFDVLLPESASLVYRVNAAAAGSYRIQALASAPAGADLRLEAGTESRIFSLPADAAVRRHTLGSLRLEAGCSTLKLEALSGETRLRQLTLFPEVPSEGGEWSGLALCHQARRMEGHGFINREEGLQMDRPVQALASFGERFLADAWIEADLIFRGDGATQSAGLFLRLSEDSWFPDQIREGHRGYYVGFDMETAFIQRLDFGATTLKTVPCMLQAERAYRVKAAIRNGTITVWLGGGLLLNVSEDDFLPFGRVGAGSFGARITVARVAYGSLPE